VLRPSRLTRFALWSICAIVVATATFLLAQYTALPDLLPVRFRRNGTPIGWHYKTFGRVLTPAIVQLALASVFGSIAALLLSRPRAIEVMHPAAESATLAGVQPRLAGVPPDVSAAVAAAEAVSLIALIWVAFQGYASLALVAMWRAGRAGLGPWYNPLQIAGLLLTAGVAVRAHVQLGRPAPRPFVPEHWRFGQLYKNPADPALFVPTRDGARWTLNFGRPMAAALLALLLIAGLLGPAVLLALALR
jgi:uncharacterized membrane protein